MRLYENEEKSWKSWEDYGGPDPFLFRPTTDAQVKRGMNQPEVTCAFLLFMHHRPFLCPDCSYFDYPVYNKYEIIDIQIHHSTIHKSTAANICIPFNQLQLEILFKKII